MQVNVPLDLVRQVYLYDLERINRGGQPMSDREAAVAIKAAQGEGGETGRGGVGGALGPVLGFAENAATDLKDIVLGLPQLPGFMLKEPKEMFDPKTGIGARLSESAEALASGDPGQALAKVAGAPGVRLVPGSYTAEMIGGGVEGDKGPSELAKHPVFTFLDLLPIASKAGVTAKATKAIKGSSPYRRAATGLERRGVGGAAVDVNRMIRQVQRAADEGDIGQVPIDARGRMGSINELRDHLVAWTKTFNREEMATTFDYLESGEWDVGRPAPKWAQESGRGDAWLEMVNDAKAMGDWWVKHGKETGEVFVLSDGSVFPNTPGVRKYLKDMKEAKHGKEKTGKKRDSAAAREIDRTAQIEQVGVELSEVTSQLAAADPVAMASTIDEAVKATESLRNPDLGVADDVTAAKSLYEADVKAVEEFSPTRESVVKEFPWPDDVAPMRFAESKYQSGERSPAVEGTTIEVRQQGRAPTKGDTKLLTVTEKIDGTVVADHAAELVRRLESAKNELSLLEKQHDLTVNQAKGVKDARLGKLYEGTLEGYVRNRNLDLADEALDLDAQAVRLSEDYTVGVGRRPVYKDGSGKPTFESERQLGSGSKQNDPMSELELQVREMANDGWEEKTFKGTVYVREPSRLRRVEQEISRIKQQIRKERDRQSKLKDVPEVGTPEAANAARVYIEAELTAVDEGTLMTRLIDHVELGARTAGKTAASAEDYRLDAGPTRPGTAHPTRITPAEKVGIRRGEPVRVVDSEGLEWEIYAASQEADGAWTGRRSPEQTGGDWDFKDFTDPDLDLMPVVSDWPESVKAKFNESATEALTNEGAQTIIDELRAAADVPPESAFVVEGTVIRSVAAQQVLIRAAEVLPSRLKALASKGEEFAEIRALAEGDHTLNVRRPGKVVNERIVEFERTLGEADVKLRDTKIAADAAERLANEVISASQEVLHVQRMMDTLTDKLAAVRAGTAKPLYKEQRVKAKSHPDEARLRGLYDLLDDLEQKGPSHEMYSVYDETVAAAKALEDAGIRVKPTDAKAKAAASTRRVEKVVKPGDAVALKAARARRTKSKRSVDAAEGFDAKVAVSMSNLKAAVVGTVENPGPLRIAEAHARNGEFSDALKKLRTTKTRLNSDTARKVRDRAEQRGHPLAAEIDAIERAIDDMIDKMPTTKQRATLINRRGRLQNRQKLLEGQKTVATVTERRARRKIEEEMTEADKSIMKFANNPRNLPAALQPLYRTGLSDMLAERVTRPPLSEKALQELTFDRLDEAAKAEGIPPKEWSAMKREAMSVLAKEIEAGATPIWLPHRQAGNRGRSSTKLFGERIVTPGQFKQRYLNPEPYVRNLAVALEQSTVDHIRRLATETLYFGDEASGITGIFPSFGRSFDDLREMYSDAIADAQAKAPWKPLQNVAFEIIKENWTSIDPQKWGLSERWAASSKINYTPKGRPGAEAVKISIENIYVPRGVATTIEGFQKTGGLVPFRNVYDNVMDVFRVSALALSPRFLVYNAVGGLAMLLIRTDPTVFKQLERAKKMVDDGDMPLGISKGAAMADPELTKSFREDLARSATERTGFLWGMQEGAWMGQMFESVRKVANKSFQFNEWFDNVYRSMAYLHEADNALKKGMSQADAAEQGVRLANKILQDWDAMTPWERVAMRRIFPFYGWMKHVLKYSFTLPFDHPLRVAVVTNFAANEMEDYRSGIPQWLAHTFFIGKEGPDTKQWSINARSVNPFSDVARLVDFDSREYGAGVVTGFFTQTSPLISAVAESLGVNPMSGRSQLYPEVVYDPERGRVRSVAPSIVHTLPSAIIPQMAGMAGLTELSGVVSVSRELRNMRVRDRDAFNARIWSSFGLPFAPRKRSRPFEMMRAGLAREQAASEAVNSALRSGDWSNALGYEQARIRGQVYNVRSLYELAKKNPELLEVVLSAANK